MVKQLWEKLRTIFFTPSQWTSTKRFYGGLQLKNLFYIYPNSSQTYSIPENFETLTGLMFYGMYFGRNFARSNNFTIYTACLFFLKQIH